MTHEVPPPHSELMRLRPLLGAWTARERTRDSVLGPGGDNGPYSEDGNRYTGAVADGRLTFEGPARFQYGLGDDGRVRVNPDGTLTVDWWLRDAAGAWAPWMRNTFTRVGD
jgi:hypothetical protein